MSLKKCPNQLCNSATVRLITLDESDPDLYDGYEEYYIKCFDCFVATRWFREEAKAIEAWNHRPFEDKAVEVLAVLLIEKQRLIADDLGISADLGSAEDFRAEARQLLGINDKEE